MDASLLGHLDKMAVVVAEQVIASPFQEIGYGPLGVREVAPVGIIEGIDGDGAVVDHKAVQVAVVVIIEKRYLGGIGGDVQPILGGGFGKSEVMVVDVKFVLAVAGAHVPGVADIDIQPAVVVDIYECDAGAPHAVLAEARFIRDVVELEIAFIKIEFVVAGVGGHYYVRKTIIVEIADSDTAAVVEVPEEEAILYRAISDVVVEVDAGMFHQIKEGMLYVGGVTGAVYEQAEEAGES